LNILVQILPELESILRSVYLVNLARRHREREDQLEKMLLDLTAVETFPPLLANADKPDATTGTIHFSTFIIHIAILVC
jgi:hypothetical protein